MREEITKAIEEGRYITLDYQEERKQVIPLCYGQLKNGQNGLLCFRLLQDSGHVIRLYHEKNITSLEVGEKHMVGDFNIDYYFTKHFKGIYARV